MYLSKIINKDIKLSKIIASRQKITGIDFDSRKIKKGMIFAAINGTESNGIKFSNKAIEAGANTILCSSKDAKKIINKHINILTTNNVRLSTSIITKKFFPKQPKNVAAITGTNGKTSIAYYLNKIWKAADLPGASIGTLGIKYKNKNITSQLTTPDPVSLHKYLDLLKRKNINFLVLEASSHGLRQNRIDSLFINRAIFSNLSRDHLDYHKTLENYFSSKKRLFSEILDKDGVAIINNNCKYGRLLESYCKKEKIKVITYGSKKSDWIIKKVDFSNSYSNVSLQKSGKEYNFKSRLLAYYQIENLVCAMATACSYKVSIKNLLKWVEKINEPPGRLERISFTKIRASIFIDYAHTPDALEKNLKELRKTLATKGKLKVLFGCGGNRDQGKRIIMGRLAADLADEVYVTDDNPRYESPKKIRMEILKFCNNGIDIKDRRRAIFKAIKSLKRFDILLIAGKGHEKYQEIRGKKYYFDDKTVILDALEELQSKC